MIVQRFATSKFSKATDTLASRNNASTVYIVEDYENTRDATANLISAAGFEIKCFATGQGFLNGFDDEQPGCVILASQMPDLSGLEIQQALKQKDFQPSIIFVIGHGDVSIVAQAHRDGAVDVIAKPVDADLLLSCIREAIKLDLARREKRAAVAEVRERLGRLTPREREIAELLATGNSCKQIGHALAISAKTVENHRASILEKMAVDNPTQLARSLGLLK